MFLFGYQNSKPQGKKLHLGQIPRMVSLSPPFFVSLIPGSRAPLRIVAAALKRRAAKAVKEAAEKEVRAEERRRKRRANSFSRCLEVVGGFLWFFFLRTRKIHVPECLGRVGV